MFDSDVDHAEWLNPTPRCAHGNERPCPDCEIALEEVAPSEIAETPVPATTGDSTWH